jgi:hypothetical protein
MIQNTLFNLNTLRKLLVQIPSFDYVKPSEWLSGASIGQHTRHILEFFEAFIDGYETGDINYDKRERKNILEENPLFAVDFIDYISNELTNCNVDKDMVLNSNFDIHSSSSMAIKTSAFREIAYCLEHCIHHQALIKVALLEFKKADLIPKTFGVAPATIRYKNRVVLPKNNNTH